MRKEDAKISICFPKNKKGSSVVVTCLSHKQEIAGAIPASPTKIQQGEKKISNYPKNWTEIATKIKKRAGFRCEQCGHPHNIRDCYILTVHHINGDKADCRDENLIALCQRCHLREEGKLIRGVSHLALKQCGQMNLLKGVN